MSTRSIGRTARIASTCASAWGPRPKTSRRRASGSASRRTASAETAERAQRWSARSRRPARRARAWSASNTTHTPWMRGVAADGDELDARRARRGAEGITSSSPPPRGRPRCAAGRPRDPGRPRSAASSASTAAATRRRRAISAVGEERRAHRRTKPVPSGSRGSSTKRCSPVLYAVPSTSVSTPSAVSPTTRACERRADDRLVPRTSPSRQHAVRGQQRAARRGPRAARRAVDLAVGEHGHVALVQRRRPVLVEDRAVDAREPLVARVAGGVAARERGLTARPAAISSRQVARARPRSPNAAARHAGVDRAAVGHVDRHAARPRDVARDHEGRHVAEGDGVHRVRRAARTRAPTRPDGTSTVTSTSPSAGAATTPRLDRPRAERDRAVAARGRVAVLVPEEHAEVGPVVVGRDEEAAVHVGVPARLVAEQPAHGVHRAPRRRACSRRSRTVAPGISGHARRSRSGTARPRCGSRWRRSPSAAIVLLAALEPDRPRREPRAVDAVRAAQRVDREHVQRALGVGDADPRRQALDDDRAAGAVTVTASSPAVPVSATRSAAPSPPGLPEAGVRFGLTCSTSVPDRSPIANVSAPPKAIGLISSTSSSSSATLATSRSKRRRPPSAARRKVSSAAAPLKERLSLPAPPSTRSSPSPGFHVKRSGASPSSARSSPRRPLTSSKPPPPTSKSLPSPPSSTSPPPPPASVIRGAPAGVEALSRSHRRRVPGAPARHRARRGRRRLRPAGRSRRRSRRSRAR